MKRNAKIKQFFVTFTKHVNSKNKIHIVNIYSLFFVNVNSVYFLLFSSQYLAR